MNASETGSMLEASALTVRRGAALLLDRVSVRVAPGELVAVIGPNGAGKSTLLRCLGGVLRPDDGFVRLDDQPLQRLSAEQRGQAIAYLPQSGPIHWSMTVGRLVALGRLPHGAAPDRLGAADMAAVTEALAATDTGHLIDRAVETLSGGERARVLAARALAVGARFLIADEPTEALDPRHQLDLLKIFQARAADGMGIVAALHDLTLAARFCTRLILLDQGHKRAEGPPATVITPSELARTYGIEALQGSFEDQPWIVPWRVLPGGHSE